MENKNLEERRIAKTRVTYALLTMLFTGNFRGNYNTNALKDLEVIGVKQSIEDHLSRVFVLYFTSSENEKLPLDCDPPWLEESFIFTRTNKENVKTD